VLREIAPTIRGALEAGDASRWFFIRYADPDSHLRLRFAGDPARLAGSLLPALERALSPLIASGAIRKVMLDTYARELIPNLLRARPGLDVSVYLNERGREHVEREPWAADVRLVSHRWLGVRGTRAVVELTALGGRDKLGEFKIHTLLAY